MKIGLHDAEKKYVKNKTFPNLALMKISAWHKAVGDTVEWWNPLYRYDRVYSSKVFDFTPDDPYLPEDAIRGGTGYRDIPMDRMLPDGRICHFSDFLDFWRMDTWSDGGKVTDWEQEAKRQCSAAGELRIQLGERLEEIRTRISAMRQMLHAEDNTMDQAILTWKISQMEEQAAWLESVLYSKRSGAGQAVDEVGQAPEGKEP